MMFAAIHDVTFNANNKAMQQVEWATIHGTDTQRVATPLPPPSHLG